MKIPAIILAIVINYLLFELAGALIIYHLYYVGAIVQLIIAPTLIVIFSWSRVLRAKATKEVLIMPPPLPVE